MMQSQLPNYCERAGPSGIQPSSLQEGAYFSLTFTELLTHEGNTSLTDTSKESDDREKSCLSVSTTMRSFRGGSSHLPNLDLSLLPSREPSEFFCAPEKSTGQADHSPQQSPCAQLTVFYAGAVHVYNVSQNMAKALMVLASSGGNGFSSSDGNGNSNSASTANTPTSFGPATPVDSTPYTPPSTRSTGETSPAVTLKTMKLPFTRQNSLQRFLEKRNDRIRSKAPYPPLHQN